RHAGDDWARNRCARAHDERYGDVSGRPAADVRLAVSGERSPGRRVGRFLVAGVSLPDYRGSRGTQPEFRTLAGAPESWPSHQLLGRDDAVHAILARAQRRPGAGVVSAAVVADDLPAEFGGSCGAFRREIDGESGRGGDKEMRIQKHTELDVYKKAFAVAME